MLDENKYTIYFPKEALDAKVIYYRLEKNGWIEKFRSGWDLPKDGFSNQNNFQRWYEEFVVKPTNKFLQSDSFKRMQKEMSVKRILWAKGKILMSDIDRYDFEVSLKNPSFKFEYDIENIMTRLAIPTYYEAFVHDTLVLKGQPKHFPVSKDTPKLDLSTDPNTGRKRLFVEVFSDTNIEDFKSALFKLNLEDYQEKLYDYGTIRQVGPENIDMWSQIYDWHFKDKKTYKAIKLLALEKFKKKFLTLEDIGTGLKRYKELLGIGTAKKRK
ncbi:MAG: hypothetical protein V4469_05145 [Patescibacteria group bacterium]